MDIENPEELTAFLRATGRVGADEPLEIRNLAGGVSNRTVYLRRSAPGPDGGPPEAWVLKQALAKLRVAVDWFADPARIDREALGIEWLGKLTQPWDAIADALASAAAATTAATGALTPDGELPGTPAGTPAATPAGTPAAAPAAAPTLPHPAIFGRIPALIFHEPSEHLLAMRAVPEPHDNFKTLLLSGRVNYRYVSQFAMLLAEIHGQSFLRRGELPAAFRDQRYFRNLRLEPYYQYTAEQVPEAAGFLHNLVASTLLRKHTLVHGDYSPKNVLFYAERLVLLDHEVIHWGDPAFDLGFALAHLLSKAHHMPDRRKEFLLAAHLFFVHYLKRLVDHQALGAWITSLEPFAVRHALGCLLARVAGRSQLEYLTPEEKTRQRAIVLTLMAKPPATVEALARAWGDKLK
ncbi:MAG: phosphotransferase family protein [Planctomycetota bacterium]